MAFQIEFRTFGDGPRSPEARQILAAFFREGPLYASVTVESDLIQPCMELLFVTGLTFDAWCPACSKEATYTLEPLLGPEKLSYLERLAFQHNRSSVSHNLEFSDAIVSLRWISFRCARSSYHKINFVCRLNRDLMSKDSNTADYSLVKIGQQPSPADLAKGDIQKYSKVLSTSNLKEFNRAIGLASHSIGIASFVYLRRIFERLVDDTLREAIPDAAQQAEVRAMRMDDRIDALAAHLPNFLVRNKGIYKILSKGIHELDEHECLSAFETVKLGIELILDEKIQKNEQKRKISAVSKSLQDLRSNLKSR